MDGRRQLVAHRVDAVTEFAQCVKQRLLRPFVHPLDPFQPVNASSKTNHRRQKPRCRAGVADEQLQRLLQRAAVGNLAAESLNRDGAVANFIRLALHFHSETEPLQAIDHQLRVFAPECAAQRCRAIGQGRQRQRAVRDAFRARHGDFRHHGILQRDSFDKVGQGHDVKAPSSKHQ